MATHRISILKGKPTSGNVFYEPYSVKSGGTGPWDMMVLVLNGGLSTRDGIYGGFHVPKNYNSSGTTKWIVKWAPDTATSGDVEWDFDYRPVAAGESMDQTSLATDGTNDTAVAVDQQEETQITATAANFAADDFVEFGFFRDQTDAGDTMSGAAIVFGIYFEYTD